MIRNLPATVLLRRDPLFLYIQPEIPELTDLLRIPELIYDVNADGLQRSLSYFCDVESDNNGPYCRCFSGFEPIVKEWLTRHGIRIKKADRRRSPLRRIRSPKLESLKKYGLPIDEGFLRFLRQSRRGIIRYSSDMQRDWLIAQVTLAFRKSKIMVTASRRNDVRTLGKAIQPYFPRVKAYFVTDFTGSRRLVLTTPAKAHAGVIEIEKRDFYLALDPLELFQDRLLSNPLLPLDQAKRARIFGFVPIERRLNRRERVLLTGIFGSEEICLYQHGHVARKVDVVSFSIRTGPRHAADADEMTVRRECVWSNGTRHRRIADIARMVSLEDEDGLQRDSSRLTDLELARRHGDVVVLVDNLDQAVSLGMALPNARIVGDRDIWGDGLSDVHRRRMADLEGRPKCVFHLLIATMAGLWRVPDVGVLIRADSGPSLPPLTPDQLSKQHRNSDRMLVIDCHDRYHPAMRGWWHARQAAYREAGWQPLRERDLTPLERFTQLTSGGGE